MQFSARQRLRKARDFQALEPNGHKINCNQFIFIAQKRSIESISSYSRVGIIASRKVGNATIRNRAKRIFREIFRLNQDQLAQPTDILIIVRASFAQESFDAIKKRFIKACQSL